MSFGLAAAVTDGVVAVVTAGALALEGMFTNSTCGAGSASELFTDAGARDALVNELPSLREGDDLLATNGAELELTDPPTAPN